MHFTNRHYSHIYSQLFAQLVINFNQNASLCLDLSV